LFLVQQLATQWGYLRDPAGTTVWFHLPTAGGPDLAAEPGPGTERSGPDPRDDDRADRYYPHPDLRGSLTSADPYARPARLRVAAM
jgi:hypothetical protein